MNDGGIKICYVEQAELKGQALGTETLSSSQM